MKKAIIKLFVDAINEADKETIRRLLTIDHTFIDAHDRIVTGIPQVMYCWEGYFNLFPDYTIEIEEIFERGASVCILGHASGTYKGLTTEDNSNYWRVPAAWKVVVENDKVSHWQVYADNIIPVDIIRKNDIGFTY